MKSKLNKKCVRCGRFKNDEHVCMPIKVMINGKLAYTISQSARQLKPKTLQRVTIVDDYELKSKLVTLFALSMVVVFALIGVAQHYSITNF